MDLKKHQKEVEKLNKIELELVKLVADTGNYSLMDKFSEFQNQRLVCNTSFTDWIGKILNDNSDPQGN